VLGGEGLEYVFEGSRELFGDDASGFWFEPKVCICCAKGSEKFVSCKWTVGVFERVPRNGRVMSVREKVYCMGIACLEVLASDDAREEVSLCFCVVKTSSAC
jgi:hypothetical protein